MQAQITFSNQTNLLNDPTLFYSGVAVGIADMNGDGLDDIVRLNEGNMLSIEYQTMPDMPFANYTHGAVEGDAWAMVIGDVNNALSLTSLMIMLRIIEYVQPVSSYGDGFVVG